jgi:antitoxin component of MazEF toxin-antitoxin module
MPEQRHVFRLGRSLVVAVPPSVRRHLGVERGTPIYWFTDQKREVVVTPNARRTGGRPEGIALRRRIADLEAEVAHLKQRNEARDRSMHAEGYNVGYLKATEALMKPHGPSAERQRRRRLRAYMFPDAVEQERRAQRQAVETTPGPDQFPPPGEASAPSAPTRAGDTAAASERKPPALPVET